MGCIIERDVDEGKQAHLARGSDGETEEERRLILPMMKNYIKKYTPAGDFEKAKARVLVRGDLQKM